MKMRMVWSGLAASAVLLASGAAFSGGTTTAVAQLMDFDRSTGELWAYPAGAPLTTYVHSAQTQHLLADLTRFTPPDPCTPAVAAWNFTVQFDAAYHVQSPFVYDALLTYMSAFQCSATVTSTTVTSKNGTPEPLLQITPTAGK